MARLALDEATAPQVATFATTACKQVEATLDKPCLGGQDHLGVPNYQGTFFNFCTRKSENTLIFGARCLLLL